MVQQWVSVRSDLAAGSMYESRHQFNININYDLLDHCVWSGKRRSCFMEEDKMKGWKNPEWAGWGKVEVSKEDWIKLNHANIKK